MPRPVFEIVSDCGALSVVISCGPKARLADERLTTGGATPVPVKYTVCGLPLALSVMVSDALRDPGAVGVNATLIEQLTPAATLLPQVFVSEKSPGFVPVRPMLEMFREEFPRLVRVTPCAALVEPIYCGVEKARLGGERATKGAGGTL